MGKVARTASAAIAGVSVPNVDGILLEAGRLWAVQNVSDQIAAVRLSSDLTTGRVEEVLTSPRFQAPTTVARHGERLAVVNGKFDTRFPPTPAQYEVVLIERQAARTGPNRATEPASLGVLAENCVRASIGGS